MSFDVFHHELHSVAMLVNEWSVLYRNVLQGPVVLHSNSHTQHTSPHVRQCQFRVTMLTIDGAFKDVTLNHILKDLPTLHLPVFTGSSQQTNQDFCDCQCQGNIEKLCQGYSIDFVQFNPYLAAMRSCFNRCHITEEQIHSLQENSFLQTRYYIYMTVY